MRLRHFGLALLATLLSHPALAGLGPKDGTALAPIELGRVRVGEVAPDFSLAASNGTVVTLSEFRGRSNVVLVFYRGHW